MFSSAGCEFKDARVDKRGRQKDEVARTRRLLNVLIPFGRWRNSDIASDLNRKNVAAAPACVMFT